MKKKDFTGMKFGDLTVLKEDTNKHLEYLEKKKRGEVINAPIFGFVNVHVAILYLCL